MICMDLRKKSEYIATTLTNAFLYSKRNAFIARYDLNSYLKFRFIFEFEVLLLYDELDW
jgi:hypothetical protein